MQYRGYINKIVDMYFAVKEAQAREREYHYYMREATLRAQTHPVNMSKFGRR